MFDHLFNFFKTGASVIQTMDGIKILSCMPTDIQCVNTHVRILITVLLCKDVMFISLMGGLLLGVSKSCYFLIDLVIFLRELPH